MIVTTILRSDDTIGMELDRYNDFAIKNNEHMKELMEDVDDNINKINQIMKSHRKKTREIIHVLHGFVLASGELSINEKLIGRYVTPYDTICIYTVTLSS